MPSVLGEEATEKVGAKKKPVAKQPAMKEPLKTGRVSTV